MVTRFNTSTSETCDVSILCDEESFLGIRADWERLLVHAAGRHFFHDFPWKWRSWLCVASRRNEALRIIVVRQNGRTVLIFPLVVNRRVGRFLNSETWEYRDLIAEESPCIEQWFRVAWTALVGLNEFDILLLQNVRSPSLLPRLLTLVKPRIWCSHSYSPVIRLCDYDGWDTYASSRSKKLIADQQRQWRRLNSALPDLRCVRVQENDAIRDLIGWMIDRKGEWAKHKNLAMRGFLSSERKELLVQAAVDANDSNRALVFELVGNGRTISAGLGFFLNKRFTFELFAYDLDWENYSPSRLLQEMMIRWCLDNNIDEFDFLPRTESGVSYKDLWANANVRSNSYAIPLSVRGRVLLHWKKSAIARSLVQSITHSSAYGLLPIELRRALRPIALHELRPIETMAPVMQEQAVGAQAAIERLRSP